MQRNCLRQQIRLSLRHASMMLFGLSATFCLTGCASKSVVVQREIPQELARPELPSWREWSTSYQDWLRGVTTDGTDAPREKTLLQK